MKFIKKIFSEEKEEYSKDYEWFLNDYFTENSMIRSHGEEDTTIWKRHKGLEFYNKRK
jgi:hypothetical protein